MKFSNLAVFATVAPLATSFAPTLNQRTFASKNVASVKSSKSCMLSMSIEFQAVLGAGVGSVGMALSGAATSTPTYVTGPSMTIAAETTTSSTQPPSSFKDAGMSFLVSLNEKEVKAAEKEAIRDAKAAKMEKRREAFFEYEVKRAAEQEAMEEALEQKYAAKAKEDELLVQKLKAEEQEAEREAAMAGTKEEKARRLAIAKKLAAKEKRAERRERRDERYERTFLAEEVQEKKILEAKTKAARAEEEKFEAVEKEFERAAKSAEQKLALKEQQDKEEVEKLKAEEIEVEREATLAGTKVEKQRRLALAKKLAAREKAAEKRERGDELEEKKIFSLEKEEFKMFAASDKAMTK